MYCDHCKQYTLKKVCNCTSTDYPTRSAHPGKWLCKKYA